MKFHPDTITVESLEKAAAMAVSVADTLCTIARDSADGTIDPRTAALAANASLADLVGPVAMAGDELLAALESFLRAPSVGSNGPGTSTIVVQEFNIRAARAALTKAKGGA